jgi:metallo-beta-lactamase family protein
MASIRFLGAAGTVTGSRFLVEAAGRRVLVDAGLFQGQKEFRLRNWAPFPVDPASLDAVVLTHAHIDHSGALPLLVRSGFRGDVWCTPATADLAGVMLPDSAKLQEEAARHANQKGYSKHAPRALPLYEAADATAAS